jgi:hypothetical protein
MLTATPRTLTASIGFGESLQCQSKEETKSLSRDVQWVLSWKGQLHSKLRSLPPFVALSVVPDRLQRREARNSWFVSRVPHFAKVQIKHNF